jgi:hypothetical protein
MVIGCWFLSLNDHGDFQVNECGPALAGHYALAILAQDQKLKA